MSTTILEALEKDQTFFSFGINRSNLNKAISLLDKGYNSSELIEPLIKEYGTIESVPKIKNDQ